MDRALFYYDPDDRFHRLGIQPPDLSFLCPKKPERSLFGRENNYNCRVLLDNWFEDRRCYQQTCPRVTGTSITKSDYIAKCLPQKLESFPPAKYALKLAQEGEGAKFLWNTEDYCDYLSNYTTTYDLMHNWEVRRAGVKPKPKRRWRLIQGAIWTPERDNAAALGNLTQLGYRKAPQLPQLPNDWDAYSNNPTSYQLDFPKPKFPDHYVHCRKAPSREIKRENEEMMLVKVPDPCDFCTKDDRGKHIDGSCACVCHAINKAIKKPCGKLSTAQVHVPYNSERFSRMVPAKRLKEHPGVQSVHSTNSPFPYRVLKRPPHLPQKFPYDRRDCPCEAQNLGPWINDTFKKPDVCKDYAGDVLQN